MNFHHVELKHAKYLFYDLYLDNKGIAENIIKELKPFSAQSLLMVGCVGISKELTNKGFNVTVLATTDDMRRYVKNSLPFTTSIHGDIRTITHNGKFDAIICLGDTLSGFTDDYEIYSVLKNAYNMLKYGGIILLENVKKAKLTDNNGSIVKVDNGNVKIKRTSRISFSAESPYTATWHEIYELVQNGQRNVYEESSKIRGLDADELRKFLKAANFEFIKMMESNKGNNFLTIARK